MEILAESRFKPFATHQLEKFTRAPDQVLVRDGWLPYGAVDFGQSVPAAVRSLENFRGRTNFFPVGFTSCIRDGTNVRTSSRKLND